MRLSSRLLLLASALVLAAPLAATPLHPRLLRSSPAADSRSAEMPRQLTLTFNEAPDLALTRITLLRGDVTLRTEALRHAADDAQTVVAPIVGELAPGRYTVRWQVTGDDGHPVRGNFSFEILAPGSAAARPNGR